MDSRDQGIYPKYLVFKHPGTEIHKVLAKYREFSDAFSPWLDITEVEDFVFVLKPLKDRHARLALSVYSESVRLEKPKLAREIREILDDYDGS